MRTQNRAIYAYTLHVRCDVCEIFSHTHYTPRVSIIYAPQYAVSSRLNNRKLLALLLLLLLLLLPRVPACVQGDSKFMCQRFFCISYKYIQNRVTKVSLTNKIKHDKQF